MNGERCRAEATWQGFDHKVALAAFGETKDLKALVADPEAFIEARPEIVLRMSDQVPFWVMLQASRQLYSEKEVRATRKQKHS